MFYLKQQKNARSGQISNCAVDQKHAIVNLQKMNNSFFVAMLGLVTLVHATYARLGETESQLISRYGKIVQTTEVNGLPLLTFEANGFTFQFSMIDGVAESFTVKKKDGLFTSQEVMQFLERNKSGNGDWIQNEVDKENFTISFTGPNGDIARYDAKNKIILVISKKLISQASLNLKRQKEKEREREESDAKKALEGF